MSSSSSTDKTRNNSGQSIKPKVMLPSVVPIRDTKIITAEGNRHRPDKAAQKKTDISTWKMSKYDAFVMVSLFQLLCRKVQIVIFEFY